MVWPWEAMEEEVTLAMKGGAKLPPRSEAFSHLSWISFHLWVSYFDMEIKFTVQFTLNQIPC